MAVFSKLKKGLRDPRRAAWELGWQYHRRLRNRTGCSIMDQDWDNLIVLDACRYDLFQEANSLEGQLSSVVSKGSSTAEFLYRNFKEPGVQHNDTVYVSGNPQTRNHEVESLFHASIPAWQDEWNDDLRTVHPADLTARTKEISESYPNKRLIVHYVQPHYPFIGEVGQQIEHRSFHGHGVVADPDDTQKSVWDRLEAGDLSEDVVWEAYRENLELTLPHVEDLASELVGKSVVTSDHGNVLGRYGVYGHPSKYYLEELVEVPWLELEWDTRKTVSEEASEESDFVDESVEERLADLGYR